jgi:hypothetical protein
LTGLAVARNTLGPGLRSGVHGSVPRRRPQHVMDTHSGQPDSLRRVDGRFLLPSLPETAAVMHPAWLEGLQAAGVRIVKPANNPAPDLVVAPPALRGTALRLGARMVLLDGRPRPSARRPGECVRRYLPVPTHSGAVVIADLSNGRVAERALAIGTHAYDVPAAAKRAVARTIVRLRFLPPILPMYSVYSRLSATPAFVRQAAQQAQLQISGWFLLIESGPDHRRLTFFLFGVRGDLEAVVKFSRLKDDGGKARREARGLDAARAAGAPLVAHAPKLLGAFELSEHHAIVQTAATGQALARVMSGRESRESKLSRMEAVADWLSDIACATSRPRSSLDPEVHETIMRAPNSVDAHQLLRVIGSAPEVFQHGDFTDWNIIIDRDSFVAVDWELARPDGFPLWDLIYLAVSALPALDDAVGADATRRDDEHVRYLHDLFRGRAASSATFLRWLRSTADASGLSTEDVPALITACLLWYSTLQTRLHARGDLPTGSGWAPLERFTADWLADPQLGTSWPLWREQISGL